MFKSSRTALFVAIASSTVLAACGGGGGSSPPSTQAGTVHFSLTDAPACGFDSVNVTVSKVRVHKSASASESDAGWTDVALNPARKINLVSLTNGVLFDLGQMPLEVGHYTQTRLVLAPNTSSTPFANSVIPTGGSEIALDTPSAVQSGIKLNNEFDVAPDTLSDFTLDFDACKSVVARGNGSYGLKPVITVIPVVVSGAIKGSIAPVPTNSHPVVSAQLNGVVVKSTVPDAIGAFTLSPLAQTAAGAGYSVVVTADNYATDAVIGVPVTAKATTTVSTPAAPLVLSASASNNVSGTVLPVAAQAAARATQSFGTTAASAITVKYTGADLTNGMYAMTLPTAAPMLGTYGAGTLPIALTAQPTAAGKYGIEAAATGYATQTVPVTVTGGNIVQNFTLN